MGSSPSVAVVVAGFDRPSLTADEQVSVRHLARYLGGYDRYLLLPTGGRLRIPGVEPRFFPRRFFGNAVAHSKLLVQRRFYEAFADYEFILIYHLDALVFSDQLAYWCQAGWDYIGAPWLRSHENPELGFRAAGNGGFSLRRVQAFLDLIGSKRRGVDPDEYWQREFAARPLPKRAVSIPWKWLKHARVFNGFRWEVTRYPAAEDLFVAVRGQHYLPGFRVAPPEVAVRFSFECGPRYCFEVTGQTLPFGCHAWWVKDREFWSQFLIPEDEAAAQDPPEVTARAAS